MAISQVWDRSKLNGVVENTTDIIVKTPVEGATYYDVPICLDDYSSTAVSLTGLSWSNGSPTVTGTALQLANVKIGSVFVGANDTSDFASGTYVTAKPTATTLTLSTNSLQAGTATTATTTLTVDATVAILRVTIGSTANDKLKLTTSIGVFNGSTATDSNGNGYDEVVYANAQNKLSLGVTEINLDTFSTNFGKLRTDS